MTEMKNECKELSDSNGSAVFRDYVEEHEAEFNGEEDDLAWKIEDLILAAEPYFDAIYKQEQWDEEREQRAYLNSECNH